MGAWTAPLLVASALLAVAGGSKALDPTNTVGALRSIGLWVPPSWVRVLGAIESALGLAALISGATALAALVALAYAGFSVFVLVALRSDGAVSSCGCLGRADTPPTRSHLTVTTSLALACAIAAFTGGGGLASIEWSAASVVTLGFAALASWLVWLVFTALPHLSAKES